MGDTPRTTIAFKESIQWDFPADYMRGKMEDLERELAAMTAEKMKYRERAWHAESQLETRHGLRKEIHTELGLTDETGDEALRKGLETIKAIKAEINGLKEKFVKAFEMQHDWNGLCPDKNTGMSSRDPDCAACKALMEVMS